MVGNEHDNKLNSILIRPTGSVSNNLTMVESIKAMQDNPMYEDTVYNKQSKHKSIRKLAESQNSPINVFEERKKAKTIHNKSEASPANHFEGCEVEFFDEEDVIDVKKRTFNLEHSVDELRYFIIPVSK